MHCDQFPASLSPVSFLMSQKIRAMAFKRKNSIKELILKVEVPGQQGSHHLRLCWNCKMSDPMPDLQNKRLRLGVPVVLCSSIRGTSLVCKVMSHTNPSPQQSLYIPERRLTTSSLLKLAFKDRRKRKN